MNNHLNYCRSAVIQFSTLNDAVLDRTQYGPALDLARKAQKFLLPEGGWLLEDHELRALDDSTALRLPFPVIALEFRPHPSELKTNEKQSSKRIVLAYEESDLIMIYPVIWMDDETTWVAYPPVAAPLNGYRAMGSSSSAPGVPIYFVKSDAQIPDCDYQDEVGVLFNFLNALQCSNVQIERSAAKKSSKKIKTALPFDDYHVLSVCLSTKYGSTKNSGGSHRSPREHLRRGHIRLLQSGKRVWVNAAVVAAGRGSGKVIKDYAIRH